MRLMIIHLLSILFILSNITPSFADYYDRFLGLMKPDFDDCKHLIQSPKKPIPTNSQNINTDITFIAMGDSQYGDDDPQKNKGQINAMNELSNSAYFWPAQEQREVSSIQNIRGMIMAGDITHWGQDGRGGEKNQLGQFIKEYGLCGNALLKYPVYEGYGNHDFYLWPNADYFSVPTDPAVDFVSYRNKYRPNVTHYTQNTDGHYSWDWDKVHFVQLNLMAADEKSTKHLQQNLTSKTGGIDYLKAFLDPRHALSFLKNDLTNYVGDSNRPVIIISHYGYSGWNRKWWNKSQRDAFYDVVKKYNVVAMIHGHTHNTSIYTYRGIPVFNVGSPYLRKYNKDKRGHFAVFRITDEYLEAMDISWDSKDAAKSLKTPANWHKFYRFSDL